MEEISCAVTVARLFQNDGYTGEGTLAGAVYSDEIEKFNRKFLLSRARC
jgi:hypothetical protein